MVRFTSAIVLFGVVGFAASAQAADYDQLPDTFRSGYPADWDMSDNGDPLDFEFGLRYFYSLGSHQLDVAGGSYSQSDTSHTIEIHGRIDDNSTETYVKGMAGYSAAIASTYTTPDAPGGRTSSLGKIAYAGADFGYIGFGTQDIQFGGFVGYQYWNDSPDMGRHNYLTASQVNDIDYNMLRLGATMRAELGDKVDLNIEAAFIPYAHVSGTYGALSVADFGGRSQSTAGSISGNLWGAAGEVMLGFHPTDSLTIRGGGRAWYLAGPTTTTYSMSGGGGTVNYVSNSTNFSTLRYGGLLELTYAF